ncbi:transposase [Lewinella sp. W8]|uniref:transposase n=1 Tax=Lewinella sp. W8 TaxID=2528208 RepID=UPI001067E3F3|nr:transposase [Lewinella sp. W8]MTB50900.1 transposase [Lewinella sp. W8]
MYLNSTVPTSSRWPMAARQTVRTRVTITIDHMKYQHQNLYHVYNRTINQELLFRKHDNYQFFIGKIRKHILPRADLIAYCLMPTHFHLLLRPKALEIFPDQAGASRGLSRGIQDLLSTYARAYNRVYQRTGNLFQQKTRAKITGALHHSGADDKGHFTGLKQSCRCFHYIHNNPERAGLVDDILAWEYSSALDYAGLRDDGLCNYHLTSTLLKINRRAGR